MPQEIRSRGSDERDPCTSLWTSYEWDHFSKENYATRILLDEYAKRLHQNSEAMSLVLDTWEPKTFTTNNT